VPFVCLFVNRITKKLLVDFREILRVKVEHGRQKSRLNFGKIRTRVMGLGLG